MAAYDTEYTGEITITPPLPWSAIHDSPFVPDSRGYADRDCKFRLAETTVETDEGTLTRKQAVAVTSTFTGPTGGYDIVEHLQELIDLHGEGRTFAGFIEADGADFGDLWRLAVVNGRAVRIRARIVWPEIPSGGA